MSLRRLGLERLDLFQLHRIDPKVPLEDQIGELGGAAGRGQDRRHRAERGQRRADRRGPQARRDRHRPEPLQPHRPHVRGRRWTTACARASASSRGSRSAPARSPSRAARSTRSPTAIGATTRRSRWPGCSSARRSSCRSPARRRWRTWRRTWARRRLRLSREQITELTDAVAPGRTADDDDPTGRTAPTTNDGRVTTTASDARRAAGSPGGGRGAGRRSPSSSRCSAPPCRRRCTPPTRATFGFGELVTTVVFAVYAVGVTAGLLLFGHWSDQVGRRPMLLAGLVLSALSAVAFLLPGALAWLFVGRVLSGLSAGIFTGTATATVVDLAPDGGRARAGLIAAAVNMGGLGAGPLLAGVLTQYAPLPAAAVLRRRPRADRRSVLRACCVVREPVPRPDERRCARGGCRCPATSAACSPAPRSPGSPASPCWGCSRPCRRPSSGRCCTTTTRRSSAWWCVVVFAASVVGQTTSSRLGLERALPVGCAGLIVGMVSDRGEPRGRVAVAAASSAR